MTITTTTNRVTFTGNGVTTAFSFPYYFLANADLVVVETVIATGVQTTKALTTDYTVTGAGNPAGGTVTAVTAPASTVTWTIYRDPGITQSVDLVENDPLPVEESVEKPLDRLTMIAQRLKDRVDRTLRQPEGDAAAIGAIPAKVDRANKALAFDSNGDPQMVETDSAVTDSGSVTFTHSDSYSAGTVGAALQNYVCVTDAPFNAVGDGVVDDTAAIQAALDTGKTVYVPRGIYYLTAPLTIEVEAQKLIGESKHNTLFTSSASGSHDLVRLKGTKTECTGIHFRPGKISAASPPTFAPLRIYGAWAHVHGNQFLSPTSGSGTAILLDDVDPATSDVIAGAYTHVIKNNIIGLSGYEFAYGIYSKCLTNGQQATKFLKNHFLCDAPIYIANGGGNTYFGNLFQSKTGTQGTPAGYAINLAASVIGEMVLGNYFERYAAGTYTSRTSADYIAVTTHGNHYDYCTVHVGRASIALIESHDNGIDLARLRASPSIEQLAYTGNGQTKTPAATFCEITGSGSARTGCYLGNGTYDGQQLILRGYTWAVEILNNPGGTVNVEFTGGAASVTFGQGAGDIKAMHLVWDAGYGAGRWFEIGRGAV